MTKLKSSDIFSVSENNFEEIALSIFDYQYKNNLVYKEFADYLGKNTPKSIDQIPFLPIEFFKTHNVVCHSVLKNKILFTSSGTTGTQTSRHIVTDTRIYKESFVKGFQLFYGNPKEWRILALLPAYLERKGSSLVYMANELISMSENPDSGFYLYNHNDLIEILNRGNKKTILLGVSFALLDLAEKYKLNLNNTTVMETGGMKGRRREITRNELHSFLTERFGVKKIHSEYGMTELLSQAYSKGEGIFKTPPWMKIIIRDPHDPFSFVANTQTGAINIIDLANINSCSFIATNDLGKKISPQSFEVLGRFDNSDIRGCSLMIN